MSHTPEPWILFEVGDRFKHQCPSSSDRTSILTTAMEDDVYFGAVYNNEDAKRIVDCVNACAGMESPADEISRLKAERDDLLAALEAFSNYIHAEQCSTDGQVHYSNGQLTALAVMARKAIAKNKGGEV